MGAISDFRIMRRLVGRWGIAGRATVALVPALLSPESLVALASTGGALVGAVPDAGVHWLIGRWGIAGRATIALPPTLLSPKYLIALASVVVAPAGTILDIGGHCLIGL